MAFSPLMQASLACFYGDQVLIIEWCAQCADALSDQAFYGVFAVVWYVSIMTPNSSYKGPVIKRWRLIACPILFDPNTA